MEYTQFMKNTIQKLDLERDRIIVDKTIQQRNGDPLFFISTENDKIYDKLIRSFEGVLFSEVGTIIMALCKEHSVPYTPGINNYNFSCIINNIETKVILASSSLSRSLMRLGRQSSEQDLGPVIIVLLHHNSAEGRIVLADCQNRYRQVKSLTCLFLSDFVEQMFGIDERKALCNAIRVINSEARKTLGYQITKLFSERNKASFIKLTAERLLSFDYDRVKSESLIILQEKNPCAKDLYWDKYQVIKYQFLSRERYKVLLGTKGFAQSFIASEWLFFKYENTELLESTYKIAGYLKSVEQLMWDIIIILGEGRLISSRGKTVVEVKQENEAFIDKTLGSLQHFLADCSNTDLFSSAFGNGGKFVRNYLKMQISAWRKNIRNGYFHKHNLYDPQRVKEVRDQTLFLYMVLLGSLNLSEEIISELNH